MENQQNNENKKKVSAILIAALVLLLGLTGYFAYQNFSLQKQLKQCFDSSSADAKEASAKNDSLTMDFKNLSGRYDSLSTVYTDLDSLFTTEKERLGKLEEELKKFNAGQTGGMSYASIKKEYVLLKARQEDYLKQIDLLKEENRKLTLENIDVKTDLQVEKDNNQALTAKVDNLNSKIQTGSVLSIAFIKADAIQVKSGSEISVTKARKTDKLRCCFTVSKNTLAAAGYKDFYLRVIDPSGTVIQNDATLGGSGEIKIKEGTTVSYTTKASVLYENENVETCVYTYGKSKNYDKGNYKFEIFYENQKVASTSIVLK
jgi:hypothetical protein